MRTPFAAVTVALVCAATAAGEPHTVQELQATKCHDDTCCDVWSSRALVGSEPDGRRLIGHGYSEVTSAISHAETLASVVCAATDDPKSCRTKWEAPGCFSGSVRATDSDVTFGGLAASYRTRAAELDYFSKNAMARCFGRKRDALVAVADELERCDRVLGELRATHHKQCAVAGWWDPSCSVEPDEPETSDDPVASLFGNKLSSPSANHVEVLWTAAGTFGGPTRVAAASQRAAQLVDECTRLRRLTGPLVATKIELVTFNEGIVNIVQKARRGTGRILLNQIGPLSDRRSLTKGWAKLLYVVPATSTCDTERVGVVRAVVAPDPSGGRKITLSASLGDNTEVIEVYETFPDKDGDTVPDDRDKCPDTKGQPKFDGCEDPDPDHDKVPDDECPNDFGPPATKGCPDRDGDGVADKDDRCPTDPGEARLFGCPRDSDGDGVPDSRDRCPNEAGAVEGCKDTDGDGVADRDDGCPTRAGGASKYPRYHGCPPACFPPGRKDTDKTKLPFGYLCDNPDPALHRCQCGADVPLRDRKNQAICWKVPPRCPRP